MEIYVKSVLFLFPCHRHRHRRRRFSLLRFTVFTIQHNFQQGSCLIIAMFSLAVQSERELRFHLLIHTDG